VGRAFAPIEKGWWFKLRSGQRLKPWHLLFPWLEQRCWPSVTLKWLGGVSCLSATCYMYLVVMAGFESHSQRGLYSLGHRISINKRVLHYKNIQVVAISFYNRRNDATFCVVQ